MEGSTSSSAAANESIAHAEQPEDNATDGSSVGDEFTGFGFCHLPDGSTVSVRTLVGNKIHFVRSLTAGLSCHITHCSDAQLCPAMHETG